MSDMNYEKPLISVLMSVYNDAEYLAASIESILRQTYSHFEFIIVDDGSTDKSGEIIDDYARIDKRIRVIHQANSGLIASLNRGLEECSGKYVARQDGDDISLAHRFSSQVEYLEQNPAVGLLGTAAETIDKHGGLLTVEDIPFISGYDNLLLAIKCYNPFVHSSVMFKRLVALEFQGYNHTDVAAEDYGLWMRISNRYRIQNLPAILVQRRLTSDMVSLSNIKRARKTVLAIKLKHLKSFPSLIELLYIAKDLAIVLLPYSIIKRLKCV
jgi:glycosyltransferase involved in cell wall biosynthesis